MHGPGWWIERGDSSERKGSILELCSLLFFVSVEMTTVGSLGGTEEAGC